MAKKSLVVGTTSYLDRIFIQDSSSSTGAGLTGLTNATSNLVCYRARDDDGNAGGTAISLQSATRGTWTSAGFVEKDATNMPGVYEFGVPNAALATGSKGVTIMFKGATNMAPLVLEYELTAWNNQDATRGGLSALPNAAAEASGGLYTRGSGAGQINQQTNGQIDANVARILNTASVATAGYVGVDWGQVTNKTTTNALTGTTISTSQTITSVSGSVGSVTGAVGSVTGAVGSVTGAVGSVTAGVTVTTNNDKTGYALSAAGTGAIWDVVNTGATHNVQNSTGKQLRQASGGTAVTLDSGTAQAGSTSNTIKLATTASTTNSVYVGNTVVITGGTGAGQSRGILGYVGSTRVATVDTNWIVTPDNTSTYEVDASANSIILDEGLLVSATGTTAVLASTASANNDVYTNGFISIVSGTGAGQTRQITAYVGSTKTVTVATWSVTPDATSGYVIVPAGNQSQQGGATAAQIAQAVYNQGVSVVSGAVGSVTGNVGGNVVGSVGSISGVSFPTNFAMLAIDSNGRVKALVDVQKNVALANFMFLMTDAVTHVPKTGLMDGMFTLKKESIDGAAPATLSGTITEVSAANLPGYYKISFTAGEMNGDVIALEFLVAGVTDTTAVTFKTSA